MCTRVHSSSAYAAGPETMMFGRKRVVVIGTSGTLRPTSAMDDSVTSITGYPSANDTTSPACPNSGLTGRNEPTGW